MRDLARNIEKDLNNFRGTAISLYKVSQLVQLVGILNCSCYSPTDLEFAKIFESAN